MKSADNLFDKYRPERFKKMDHAIAKLEFDFVPTFHLF